MNPLRHLVRVHPRLLALLCFAALAMKLLVPPGFMISPASKSFTVQLCTGFGTIEKTIEIPMDSKNSGQKHGGSNDPSSQPCPFAGFAQPVLAGADPAQLIIAMLFILLTGMQPRQMLLPGAIKYVRPPLRGPPVPA